MKSLEEVREFFKQDRFAASLGITIDEIAENYAVCSLELRESHLNALGSAQGGLIYTLADFAFAVAANQERCDTVTLNSSIYYLRPPKGKSLTAQASCVRRSPGVCFFHVGITDDLDTQVARMETVGYTKQK